ncbi:MAG: helix-turn-helix transcriptional regulator [Betaproteobacteria bacterium]|nr:helix-turn-helix transcriptional regulator [Betaproteobacteria bacterium]
MVKILRMFEGQFGRLVLSEASGPLAPLDCAEHLVLVKQSGSDGSYAVAGEPVPFTRNDVVLVNARQRFEFHRSAEGAPTRFVTCHFSDAWLRERFPALFSAGRAAPFRSVHEPITPRIRRLADVLVTEAVNDRFLSADRLEFMLQELMLSIIDSYLASKRVSSPLWRGSRFTDHRIRKALALLREKPNKEHNMDDLAAQVGLSRSRFYDLFQASTGLPPRSYLDLLCVESAIAKLSGESTRIGDVSEQLGFSAQSNFTRFFLSQVGIAPSEYRRASAHAGAVDPPPADD